MNSGHQWWAHQLIGGRVEGSNMMSETLAEYSALMVMQQKYGRDNMHRFLKHELDRYLRGRAGEIRRERPVVLVQNEPYVWYQKGGQVMYTLADYIGEDKVNLALHNFLMQYRYANAGDSQSGPYPDTRPLLEALRAQTPADLQYYITDAFENIVLYDNKAVSATVTPTADHKYKVTLTVQVRKLQADGSGVETPMPLHDFIDIGVFNGKKDEEKPLYLKKVWLTQPTQTFEIIVDQPPTRAGIDPFNKLIDRDSDDNWMAGFEALMWRRRYSERNAVMGSTLAARHAGIAEAMPDTTVSSRAPKRSTKGSRELAFAHFSRTVFQASVRAKPAAMPLPTLTQSGGKHDAQHMAAVSAEGHANTKLVGALRDRVRHDAIEPNRRQSQGEAAEYAENPGGQTLLLPLGPVGDPFVEVSRRCRKSADSDSPRRDSRARARSRVSGGDLGPDEDLGAHRHVQRKGHVDGRGDGVGQAVVAGIVDNADDPAAMSRLFPVGRESTADGGRGSAISRSDRWRRHSGSSAAPGSG